MTLPHNKSFNYLKEVVRVCQSRTPTYAFLHGHVLDVLRSMPDKCVHAVITSPPYWGLRDYGIAPIVWGGDYRCLHRYNDARVSLKKSGGLGLLSRIQQKPSGKRNHIAAQAQSCMMCSAWRGSLGLEPTSEEYIIHLVEIFLQVRRVLRDDGVAWLNIGDTYVGGTVGRKDAERKYKKLAKCPAPTSRIAEIAPGNRLLIPERLEIALQKSGWCVRDVISWVKMWVDENNKSDGSSMPGGTGGTRFSPAWEPVIMLTKYHNHYFDIEAVKTLSRSHPRNVLRVNLQPYSGGHVAPFPEGLVSPLIKASTSSHGCCPNCGAGYIREHPLVQTIGWIPSCKCFGKQIKVKRMVQLKVKGIGRLAPKILKSYEYKMPERDIRVRPAIVLDPFCGSGTAGQVALGLRQSFIGIDLDGKNIKLAEERISSRWSGKTFSMR